MDRLAEAVAEDKEEKEKQERAGQNVRGEEEEQESVGQNARGSRCQQATGLKRGFEELQSWPNVICSKCNITVDRWSRMESTGPFLDFPNSTYKFFYRCVKCVLGDDASLSSEKEAFLFIIENRKNAKQRKNGSKHSRKVC
jgi:hypothetical protein